jgi:probable addiction module antidote protein
MAKTKTKKFDAAKYLDHPETIAAYLNDAFESKNAAEIALALGTVARAAGMTKISEHTGLGRESLYKSLSGDVMPNFDTVQRVLHSFGLKLVVEPAAQVTEAA